MSGRLFIAQLAVFVGVYLLGLVAILAALELERYSRAEPSPPPPPPPCREWVAT